MARPKKYVVRLTDEEVERLQKIAKRKNTSPTIRDRCNVLLDMDESHPPPVKQVECAKNRGVTQKTVVNTVQQYCNEGLDAGLFPDINDFCIELRYASLVCGFTA